MRKLLPFVLLFVLVVVLAACKNSGDEQTTVPGGQTLFPGIATTTETAASNESSVQNVGNTYVLTTTPDMTMPSVPTTQFNVANESTAAADPFTTQPLSTDLSFTVPNMTAPIVNSSSLPSTTAVPTTITTTGDLVSSTTSSRASENTASSKPTATTEKATTKPTQNAKAVTVGINDVGLSGSKFLITLSGGDYKSNSTVISVKIDGETYDNIPCKISAGSINGDGGQVIVIDLSGVSGEVYEGAQVSGTVPGGFLQSRDGKTYNNPLGFSAGI